MLWLRESEKSVGLNDIYRQTGLAKATAYRLLKSLERLEFIEKEYGTDKYKIGRNALYVGQGYITSGTRERIRNILKEVTLETKLTATLSVLDGAAVLFIGVYEGPGRVRVTVQPGTRVPAYASASGKVMLSGLEDSEILARFKGVKFNRLTLKTIPTVNRLLSDIAKVRLRGFGENDEENDDGVSALGVPIKNTKGEFEAAVNVVFPAGTISWKEKLDLVKKLQSAAEEIEKIGGVLNAKLDILP